MCLIALNGNSEVCCVWPSPVATVACQYLSLDWLQLACSAVHSWPAHCTLHGIVFTPCIENGVCSLERRRRLSQTRGMGNANALPSISKMWWPQKCVKSVMNFQRISKNTFYSVQTDNPFCRVSVFLFPSKESAFCSFLTHLWLLFPMTWCWNRQKKRTSRGPVEAWWLCRNCCVYVVYACVLYTSLSMCFHTHIPFRIRVLFLPFPRSCLSVIQLQCLDIPHSPSFPSGLP